VKIPCFVLYGQASASRDGLPVFRRKLLKEGKSLQYDPGGPAYQRLLCLDDLRVELESLLETCEKELTEASAKLAALPSPFRGGTGVTFGEGCVGTNTLAAIDASPLPVSALPIDKDALRADCIALKRTESGLREELEKVRRSINECRQAAATVDDVAAAVLHGLRAVDAQAVSGDGETKEFITQLQTEFAPTTVLGQIFDLCRATASSGPHGRRFPQLIVNFAMSIYARSSAAYRALLAAIPVLPSVRTLQRCMQDVGDSTTPTAGLCQSGLTSITEAARSCGAFSGHPEKRIVYLTFDEVYTAKGDAVKSGCTTGVLVGYGEVSALDNAASVSVDGSARVAAYSDAQHTLAATAMQVMAVSSYGDFSAVVATYFHKEGHRTKFQDMHLHLHEVVTALDACGLRVMAFVADGHAGNKLIRSLNVDKAETPASATAPPKVKPQRSAKDKKVLQGLMAEVTALQVQLNNVRDAMAYFDFVGNVDGQVVTGAEESVLQGKLRTVVESAEAKAAESVDRMEYMNATDARIADAKAAAIGDGDGGGAGARAASIERTVDELLQRNVSAAQHPIHSHLRLLFMSDPAHLVR
jgi:hypothetical protein